jgi:hypothetical protein
MVTLVPVKLQVTRVPGEEPVAVSQMNGGRNPAIGPTAADAEVMRQEMPLLTVTWTGADVLELSAGWVPERVTAAAAEAVSLEQPGG